MVTTTVRWIFSVAIIVAGCGSSEDIDCAVINNPGVELVSPAGAEVLTYGTTVAVKWKVDPEKVAAVEIKVSTGSQDGPFYSIFTAAIAVDPDGGIQCMDTLWTIGREAGASIRYAPPQTVYLRLEETGSGKKYWDVSGMITINK